MFILRCAASLALIFLAACQTSAPADRSVASNPPPERHTPYNLDKSDIVAVQTGTRSSLKDPDSARFGKMVAGTNSKGEVIVCLMVNAKNSYGGYTGEKPYFGMLFRDKKPTKFVVVPDTSGLPQYRDEAVFKVCSDYGLSPVG